MKTWFVSIEGFAILSGVAMLAFFGYAFLESRYFLADWTPGVGATAVQMIVLQAILGGWMWAVLSGWAGGRSGLMTAMVLSIVVALIMLYDIIFYSPVEYGWPLVQIMLWVTFVASVLAGISARLVYYQEIG